MKELFKKIKSDRIIKLSLFFSLSILVIHLAYLVILYNFLPPFLPIFNQMPWGKERLGVKAEIFLPLFINIAFFLLNFILTLRFYEKIPLLSRVLSTTSLLICSLSFIFIVRTVQTII